MNTWIHMVVPVVATNFARNLVLCYVMTYQKAINYRGNGQKYEKIKCNMQNHKFSCEIAYYHAHSCEALVTPSATERFARRLTRVCVFSNSNWLIMAWSLYLLEHLDCSELDNQRYIVSINVSYKHNTLLLWVDSCEIVMKTYLLLPL